VEVQASPLCEEVVAPLDRPFSVDWVRSENPINSFTTTEEHKILPGTNRKPSRRFEALVFERK